MSVDRAARIASAFLVLLTISLLAGHTYAACATLCKQFSCGAATNPSPDPNFPCILFNANQASVPDTDWMVDPPGGTRTFSWLDVEVQKCPTCTQSCFFAPSEASGCSPATPGCPEGLCCEHWEYRAWYYCYEGSPQ